MVDYNSVHHSNIHKRISNKNEQCISSFFPQSKLSIPIQNSSLAYVNSSGISFKLHFVTKFHNTVSLVSIPKLPYQSLYKTSAILTNLSHVFLYTHSLHTTHLNLFFMFFPSFCNTHIQQIFPHTFSFTSNFITPYLSVFIQTIQTSILSTFLHHSHNTTTNSEQQLTTTHNSNTQKNQQKKQQFSTQIQ